MFETSNKIRGKHSNIKDFLVLRAQIPLNIDPRDSLYFVPDPLFIYANLNEINIQVLEPFLNWINYAPKKSDSSELLNLLVLDMFEDLSADPEMNSEEVLNKAASFRSNSTRIGENNNTAFDSLSSSSVHTRRSVPIKQKVTSVHVKKQKR